MTVSAHFDGKVIVPDEPLDLPPNQALILQIETVCGKDRSADGSALAWIAANTVDSEALLTDLADRHDPIKPSKGSLEGDAQYSRAKARQQPTSAARIYC